MNIFTECFKSGSLNAEFQVEYFKYYISYRNSILAYSFFSSKWEFNGLLYNKIQTKNITKCSQPILVFFMSFTVVQVAFFFFFSKDSLNSCCCCSESILLVPCLSILSPLDKKSVLSLFFTLEHLPAQSRIYFVCFFAKLSW